MDKENPVIERWARLRGHEFDLEAAARAFQMNPICTVFKDNDGHYYIKVPVLYDIRDGWEFKRAVEEFLDRLNGAMAAGYQGHYQPVSFEQMVPVHANGGRGAVILVEPGYIRTKAGEVSVRVNEEKQRPQPSCSERWITLSDEDDDLTDALVFVGRDANWFDLYKAYEVIVRRLGGEAATQKSLFGEDEQNARRAELERFRRTANTLHRHRNKAWPPPKNPMNLGEAKSLILNLVSRFAQWLESSAGDQA